MQEQATPIVKAPDEPTPAPGSKVAGKAQSTISDPPPVKPAVASGTALAPVGSQVPTNVKVEQKGATLPAAVVARIQSPAQSTSAAGKPTLATNANLTARSSASPAPAVRPTIPSGLPRGPIKVPAAGFKPVPLGQTMQAARPGVIMTSVPNQYGQVNRPVPATSVPVKRPDAQTAKPLTGVPTAAARAANPLLTAVRPPVVYAGSSTVSQRTLELQARAAVAGSQMGASMSQQAQQRLLQQQQLQQQQQRALAQSQSQAHNQPQQPRPVSTVPVRPPSNPTSTAMPTPPAGTASLTAPIDPKDEAENERTRLENRERKKRWREANEDRNKDNDLRCRVNKRAHKLFGKESSKMKEAWIEEEFNKRKSKRQEKEGKGPDGHPLIEGTDLVNLNHFEMSSAIMATLTEYANGPVAAATAPKEDPDLTMMLRKLREDPNTIRLLLLGDYDKERGSATPGIQNPLTQDNLNNMNDDSDPDVPMHDSSMHEDEDGNGGEETNSVSQKASVEPPTARPVQDVAMPDIHTKVAPTTYITDYNRYNSYSDTSSGFDSQMALSLSSELFRLAVRHHARAGNAVPLAAMQVNKSNGTPNPNLQRPATQTSAIVARPVQSAQVAPRATNIPPRTPQQIAQGTQPFLPTTTSRPQSASPAVGVAQSTNHNTTNVQAVIPASTPISRPNVGPSDTSTNQPSAPAIIPIKAEIEA